MYHLEGMLMWLSILIVVMFVGIVASLATALFRLVRDPSDGKGTLRALTVRIGLSVALFVVLMSLIAFDVIQPHGLYPVPPQTGS
jgi:hypothetical protein